MSLFVRASDKSKIKFDCVELSPEELDKITTLVQDNGGEVGENDIPVKFIPRQKYKDGMYPWNILYDINYIHKCITAQRLVRLRPFRLTPKRFSEQCTAMRFLHGYCCYKKSLLETQIRGGSMDLSSSSSDDEVFNARKSTNRYNHPEVQTQEWVDIECSPDHESQLVRKRIIPIDESQSVVTSEFTARLQAGDDAETNIKETPRQDALPIEVTSSQKKSPVYATPARNVDIKEEIPDSEAWGNIPETPLLLIPPEERSPRNHVSTSAGVDDTIVPPISDIAELPITETSTNIPPISENQITLPPLPESSESRPAAIAEKSLTASHVNPSTPRKPSRRRSSTNELEIYLDSAVVNDIKQEIPDSVAWKNIPETQSYLVATGESSSPNRVSSSAGDEDATSSPDFIEGSMTEKTTNTPPNPENPIDQSQFIETSKSSPAVVVNASRKTPVKRPLTIKSDIRLESDLLKNLRRDDPDEWISVKKNTKHDESVKEYILPDGTRVPLLRPNVVSVEPTEHSSSTDSLNEILSSERGKGKKKTTTVGTKETTNARLWDEPGPSTGKPRQCSTFTTIPTVDDSTDDDDDVATRKVTPPELSSDESDDSRNQKKTNKSNFEKNKTRIRSVKSKSDETTSTSRGTKTKTTSKTKERAPKKSRANAIFISSDSDTEPSPQNSKRRKVDESQRSEDSENIRASEDEGSDEEDNSGPRIEMDVEGNVIERRPGKRQAGNVRYAQRWRRNLDADRPADCPITKLNFTGQEKQTMIDYLLTFENIRSQRPKGYRVWQKMIQSGLLPYRTPQSLQNHFVKILLPDIEQWFGPMTDQQRKQFLALKGSK